MSMRCLMVMLMTAASVGAAHAWVSHEHSEMGDAAFLFAIAALDTDAPGTSAKLLSQPHLASGNDVARGVSISAVANGEDVTNDKNEVEQFSFGDLVAIYGDFAEGFNDVNDAGFGKRAASLKQIVRSGRVSDFPDELKILLSLAVDNANHFSLRAAQTYVQNHRQALLFAPQKDRLWQALHYEALALHSFTDDFAVCARRRKNRPANLVPVRRSFHDNGSASSSARRLIAHGLFARPAIAMGARRCRVHRIPHQRP